MEREFLEHTIGDEALINPTQGIDESHQNVLGLHLQFPGSRTFAIN